MKLTNYFECLWYSCFNKIDVRIFMSVVFVVCLILPTFSDATDSEVFVKNGESTILIKAGLSSPEPETLSLQVESLFKLTQPDHRRPDLMGLKNSLKQASIKDVNWPLLCYLTGEVQLKYDDIAGAKQSFNLLVQWAGHLSKDDPYFGRWGGSGVVGTGLWRLLTIFDRESNLSNRQVEIKTLLDNADKIVQTPLFIGMGANALLPSIPILQEDIAKLLVNVSWKAGLKKEAKKRFINFISVDSTGDYFGSEIDAIKKEMLEKHQISDIRLESFRLYRKLTFITTLAKKKEIIERIKVLWNSKNAPEDIRIKAGYEWAYFYRKNRGKRKEATDILQFIVDNYLEKYPVTTQKSLYLIAMMNNSGKTAGRNRKKFFNYMQKIIDTFPNGQMTDDALYQVASEYLFFPTVNWNLALKYYKKLRDFKASNDWLDSAYFLGAITYINRRKDGDLAAADRLLREYLEIQPNGYFHLRCRFWRARIAEMENRKEEAKKLFFAVIELAPYSYYGIRSKMHLELGEQAMNVGISKQGSKVLNDLRKAFKQSTVVSNLLDKTPFHKRLDSNKKLYLETKAVVDDIGKEFKNRLDNIALNELDRRHLIPTVTLLLAFRQDAIAAKKSFLSAENNLRLAGFFGIKMNDWPVALSMLHIRSNKPRDRLQSLMNDGHFLATAYPSPGLLPKLKPALQSALKRYRWTGKEMDEFSKSLMYSIIRRESSYFSAAISDAGAIGWFQLLPKTYEDGKLRECQNGCERFSAFNPVCNVNFWACWVKKENLMKPSKTMKVIGDNDIRLSSIFGLVKHNAGSGTLNRWVYEWGNKPMAKDLEMKIDTFRFPHTQSFVRRVVEDVTLMESSGKFSEIVIGMRR